MLLVCDPITSATALLSNPLASSLHERHCAALERVLELGASGFLYTQAREVADLLVAAARASARRPELRAMLGKLIGCALCRQSHSPPQASLHRGLRTLAVVQRSGTWVSDTKRSIVPCSAERWCGTQRTIPASAPAEPAPHGRL